MLGDRSLERLVNVLETMLQDVAKADERRKADAAQLQVIDQLLEVDRAARVLRGMDPNVAVLADREIPLTPSANLVHFGSIDGRPGLADVVCGTLSGDLVVHGHTSSRICILDP